MLFTEDTVRADLLSLLQIVGAPKNEREARVAAAAQELHIETLLDRHPFDLSGGEQQKCALSKVLLTNPDLLLLDEPTKGMDAACKQGLKVLLRTLREKGLCILIVTHDAEFAAETADRCALLFDGEILSAAPPRDFFSENYFYTTAANRIARGFCEHAVTCEAVAAAANRAERRMCHAEKVLGIVLLACAFRCGCGRALAVWGQRYAWVTLCVAVLACVPFFLSFESSRAGAQRLALLAVMTALSVAGRVLFAAIPGFKPVTALVVLTAMYFGPQAGFMTGALSALLSNFYFGQGPWTPMQMLAWGMVGFLAGLFAKRLQKSRVSLILYGAFAGVLFSFVMDIWTVLWWDGGFNAVRYAAAVVSLQGSLPFMPSPTSCFCSCLQSLLGAYLRVCSKSTGFKRGTPKQLTF